MDKPAIARRRRRTETDHGPCSIDTLACWGVDSFRLEQVPWRAAGTFDKMFSGFLGPSFQKCLGHPQVYNPAPWFAGPENAICAPSCRALRGSDSVVHARHSAILSLSYDVHATNEMALTQMQALQHVASSEVLQSLMLVT